MGAYDSRIDHQPFQIGFAGKHGKHFVEHAHLDPTVIAPFYGAIVTQSFWQVSPAAARTGHPQQRVQKQPIVRARATHEAMRTSPYLTAASAAKRSGLTVPSVNAALDQLQKLGIVEEAIGRRRGRVFVYRAYMDILGDGAGS